VVAGRVPGQLRTSIEQSLIEWPGVATSINLFHEEGTIPLTFLQLVNPSEQGASDPNF
jgi:hypothetical protein